MPESVLVPPTPEINQSDSPAEIQQTTDNVMALFDKVVPEKGKSKAVLPPAAAPELPKPAQAVTAPVETPKTEPEPPPAAPDKIEEHKVPSFIEKALGAEPVKPETPVAAVEDEWPEELPAFKDKNEAKERWKAFRNQYKTLKEKNQALESRPAGVDEPTKQRLEFLENQAKELNTQLSRTSVEQHQEFQNKILRPMNAAWQEAARIVHETGGDPQDLARALALSGKAHFEALDTIFEGMPESAKIETNNAIAAWRRADGVRRQWLENAPKMAEQLKKGDLQRQYETISKQKQDMGVMFDDVIRTLREEARVEVLQTSTDPDAKAWNDQAQQIINTSKNIFLENTDMKKVAYACALAPMADVYRKLWLTARAELKKTNGVMESKFGAEPNMSESGGNVRNGSSTVEEDIKKPFKDVFLREFHKAHAR